MKAKFNEEKSTLDINGKKFNVISAKSELKAGDFKNGEWVNNKRYVTFEIEEIKEMKQPQRGFKAGDKVRIKDGISSETHMDEPPAFRPYMDKFIGKELTVKGRSSSGHIQVLETIFIFAEDWLEPWSGEKEELKEGDMAIFWDEQPGIAAIRIFSKKKRGLYYDSLSIEWRHAVKFECTKGLRAQYEKVRKGEITL